MSSEKVECSWCSASDSGHCYCYEKWPPSCPCANGDTTACTTLCDRCNSCMNCNCENCVGSEGSCYPGSCYNSWEEEEWDYRTKVELLRKYIRKSAHIGVLREEVLQETMEMKYLCGKDHSNPENVNYCGCKDDYYHISVADLVEEVVYDYRMSTE